VQVVVERLVVARGHYRNGALVVIIRRRRASRSSQRTRGDEVARVLVVDGRPRLGLLEPGAAICHSHRVDDLVIRCKRLMRRRLCWCRWEEEAGEVAAHEVGAGVAQDGARAYSAHTVPIAGALRRGPQA